MVSKTALVLGASGLVGRALVQVLEKENYYEKIIVVVRRPLQTRDTRIHQVVINDFTRMDIYKDQLEANDYYCTVGTTLKKAKTEDEFRRVNIGYPLSLARIAKDNPKFDQFLVISADGADSESPITYSMIKGELEDKLAVLGLKSLQIFQPSLVTGRRSELRITEQIRKVGSQILSFFIVSKGRRLNSVKDLELASAMFNIAVSRKTGVEKYPPRVIQKLIN